MQANVSSRCGEPCASRWSPFDGHPEFTVPICAGCYEVLRCDEAARQGFAAAIEAEVLYLTDRTD